MLNRKSADRMALIMLMLRDVNSGSASLNFKSVDQTFSKFSFVPTARAYSSKGQRYDMMDQRNEKVHDWESRRRNMKNVMEEFEVEIELSLWFHKV